MGQRRVHGELSLVLWRQCIKMADGVQLADGISDEYYSMLSAKKYRYIIFHIQDEKTIVIESTGGRDSTYDEYLEKLPDDACSCKIREKMLYSSSFRPLEKALQGVGARIEVTDKSEAAQEAVIEKMKLFLT